MFGTVSVQWLENYSTCFQPLAGLLSVQVKYNQNFTLNLFSTRLLPFYWTLFCFLREKIMHNAYYITMDFISIGH